MAYSGSMSKHYTPKLAAKFGFSVKNQNEALYASRFLGIYLYSKISPRRPIVSM